MLIRKADVADLSTIVSIVHQTIEAIYPRYYPRGAVDFFIAHHNIEAIRQDIGDGLVMVCCEAEKITGTVTVRDNEILRLFVLPEMQGNGYGKALLSFAEDRVSHQYPEILIDASLPAKPLYLKRGYRECGYHILAAGSDHLCYDQMSKRSQYTGTETANNHETERRQ